MACLQHVYLKTPIIEHVYYGLKSNQCCNMGLHLLKKFRDSQNEKVSIIKEIPPKKRKKTNTNEKSRQLVPILPGCFK